jgi:hypothetical protein
MIALFRYRAHIQSERLTDGGDVVVSQSGRALLPTAEGTANSSHRAAQDRMPRVETNILRTVRRRDRRQVALRRARAPGKLR